MKTRLASALFAAALLALSLPAAADGKLVVVATLPDLARIAEAVGGDRITATSIASGVQDPHFVDPKPSFVVKLRDADLFLLNGLELEIGWAAPLLEGARNPKITPGAPGYVDCSAGVPLLELPTGALSRADGDVHPLGNPHYLADPLNGKLVAQTIATALSRASPADAPLFEQRRKAFARSIDEALFGRELVEQLGGAKLDRLARAGELQSFLKGQQLEGRLGGWLGRMAPLQGRKLVMYHRSYSYFLARFGLQAVNFVELRAGIPPGPSHLAGLIQQMKGESIPVLGTHGFYDPKVPALVADKSGAKVVVLPLLVGGVKGADDYLSFFDTSTTLLARAFGGQP